MLNLQPDGGKAMPYQMRQPIKLVEKYRLSIAGDDAGPTEDQ